MTEITIPHFDSPGHALAYFERYPERIKLKSEKWRNAFVAWYEKDYRRFLSYKEENPIYCFKPNLPQSKLYYSLNNAGHMPRVLIFEGSNKSGKSTGAVAWQIAMGVGFFPWLKPIDGQIDHFDFSANWKLHREIRCITTGLESVMELSEKFCQIAGKLVPKLRVPNVNLAVGETYTESVDKDLVPKYLEFLPKEWGIETKKNQQGVINKITLTAGPGRGTIFHFRSYQSSASEFEGIDVSGSILFNEPPPEDVVIAIKRGALPYDTRTMFAFTALKEPWVYRDYVYKASRWLL